MEKILYIIDEHLWLIDESMLMPIFSTVDTSKYRYHAAMVLIVIKICETVNARKYKIGWRDGVALRNVQK